LETYETFERLTQILKWSFEEWDVSDGINLTDFIYVFATDVIKFNVPKMKQFSISCETIRT